MLTGCSLFQWIKIKLVVNAHGTFRSIVMKKFYLIYNGTWWMLQKNVQFNISDILQVKYRSRKIHFWLRQLNKIAVIWDFEISRNSKWVVIIFSCLNFLLHQDYVRSSISIKLIMEFNVQTIQKFCILNNFVWSNMWYNYVGTHVIKCEFLF